MKAALEASTQISVCRCVGVEQGEGRKGSLPGEEPKGGMLMLSVQGELLQSQGPKAQSSPGANPHTAMSKLEIKMRGTQWC